MIEAAALLSAIVRKWEDLSIIVIMLPVNALLDFFQEHRALNALKALKQKLASTAIVLRGGEFRSIMAREPVPGDIIKLRIGDIEPADVRLVSGDYLLVDQSALTGESLPVSKQTADTAYANTTVKQGEMLAVAVNTGARTNFHSVVSLVAKAQLEERSHFQKMVIRIGNFLILLTVALVLLILMVALFRHENFIEIARLALVLTVAAIPVALPAVLSVTMAIGALTLARKQAIVSRLTAIEDLAGVAVSRWRDNRLQLKRHRCGTRRRGYHPDSSGTGSDQRCHQAGAHHLRTDEELLHLPRRRDDPHHPVHDAVHRGVQLLPRDGADDHHPDPAQ